MVGVRAIYLAIDVTRSIAYGVIYLLVSEYVYISQTALCLASSLWSPLFGLFVSGKPFSPSARLASKPNTQVVGHIACPRHPYSCANNVVHIQHTQLLQNGSWPHSKTPKPQEDVIKTVSRVVKQHRHNRLPMVDQGYGRGGTPVFTGVFEPLARVTLYLTDENGLDR